jgi:ADP-ribosyl-[dinitrogen reductase] hydrolase
MLKSNIKDALFGLAVGDALGVPYEFKNRQIMRNNPATDMIGYGTYKLPPGTFSDDSSLAFCLAEALTKGYSVHNIGDNFVNWLYNDYWTPRGNVFDVGISTQKAIERLKNGIHPAHAGGFKDYENGNGSLMRILPLLFYLRDKPIDERFRLTSEVSSITHGHIRSVIACFYFLEYSNLMIQGVDKLTAYHSLKETIPQFLDKLQIISDEINHFDRLLKNDIHTLSETEIYSSGYVIHTLEASVWAFLTTDNYSDAVLRAVNLGEDTDTTATVTGGLAGLFNGYQSIPSSWIEQLARKDDIENLSERLSVALEGQSRY